MNNKEFTSELAERLGYTIKDTSELMNSLLSSMTQELEEGNVIAIQGFGSFEVKKKAERISVNPANGKLLYLLMNRQKCLKNGLRCVQSKKKQSFIC